MKLKTLILRSLINARNKTSPKHIQYTYIEEKNRKVFFMDTEFSHYLRDTGTDIVIYEEVFFFFDKNIILHALKSFTRKKNENKLFCFVS